MTVRRIEMTEATESLAAYAQQVDDRDEPVVVTSGGRPVAAVIPISDEDDLESILLSSNPKFMEIIERSRARHATEGGIPHDEMKRRLGL